MNNEKREKFTTTLKPSIVMNAKKMAPFLGVKDVNDVIEMLIQDKWEEFKNEMVREITESRTSEKDSN